jgi:REP-associated tyrosine transposase
MTNHYHLLVETPDANLSKGMRQLNGVYTQYINRTYRRVGHLLQGRFKGILVEQETYLLELARYIVLNPVRAGRVTEAAAWPWSSYRGTVGLEARPPFLTTEGLLSRFGTDRGAAAEGFARFVAEGRAKPSPWSELKAQIFLGSERFVEAMQRHIRHDQPLREVPLQQRRPPARALSDYAARGADPDRAMAEAYRSEMCEGRPGPGLCAGQRGQARFILQGAPEQQTGVNQRSSGNRHPLPVPCADALPPRRSQDKCPRS